MGQVATKARDVAPKHRPRARTLARQLNDRVLGFKDWIARTAVLFSTAPAFDMGGDDTKAAEHLGLMEHYADQFSRDLYRLNQRGWGPKAATGRDARLPAIGTKITRSYKGRDHVVEVTAGGLSYRGRTYSSISTVGKKITGSATNGYKFFGLIP